MCFCRNDRVWDFAANDTEAQTLLAFDGFFSRWCPDVSLFLSSVSFTDCSGERVQFEVGEPSGFRVSQAGVIYASQRLSLAGQGNMVVTVYARDQRSKQVWKTKVHLHAAPLKVKQLNLEASQCLKWLQNIYIILFLISVEEVYRSGKNKVFRVHAIWYVTMKSLRKKTCLRFEMCSLKKKDSIFFICDKKNKNKFDNIYKKNYCYPFLGC